jgi:hypothetical protein
LTGKTPSDVKGNWLFFLLGAATGYLGAVMYRKISEGGFAEDAEAIRERLAENVQTLEDRIASVLDATMDSSGAKPSSAKA